MTVGHVAALDFGATSGRVIVGEVGADVLRMRQFARFANAPVRVQDRLHWDVLSLWRGALDGLATAGREVPELLSVATDTWGVDYALLRGGQMLSNPVHYRDERTAEPLLRVHHRLAPSAQYSRAGIQILPINTIYQLAADQESGMLDAADTVLLMPDLFSYWLSGVCVSERTMASTTGLLNAQSGKWDVDLIAAAGFRANLLPDIVEPGIRLGPLRADLVDDLGIEPQVLTIGAHDTASAVVATPIPPHGAAFISCGTWGLVGVERDQPVLTEKARAAGFTNESGVDGSYLLMRNAMGLWMLSESLRQWHAGGTAHDLPELLTAATAVTSEMPVVDVDDPVFAAPGDIPDRIVRWCAERALPVPHGPAEIVRCIIESLAAAFADAAHEAARLAQTTLHQINIVGGGSQNGLLCQRIADRAGLPVLAGPVEATALGSILQQARTVGVFDGSIDDLRELVRRTHVLRRYDPR